MVLHNLFRGKRKEARLLNPPRKGFGGLRADFQSGGAGKNQAQLGPECVVIKLDLVKIAGKLLHLIQKQIDRRAARR